MITSKIMREAVNCAFDHEVRRNGKVSSHSQLERWIISELNKSTNPDSVQTLENLMWNLFKIELVDVEGEESELDMSAKALDEMKTRYSGYGLYVSSEGSGFFAMRYETDAEDYHALVTGNCGDNIPDNMTVPVQFGLYNSDDDLIFFKEYEDSVEMFNDKHIVFLLGQ